MPLQNRVMPDGTIVRIAQRGMFTGNRGIIHDPDTRTLLSKRWTTKAWLICVCEFRGRRRAVMAARSWTELFFLDEATALAAGHRPCFFCRREAAEHFRDSWACGNGGKRPAAAAIDVALHAERLEGKGKRSHPLPGPVESLPDGTMLAAGGDWLLVWRGRCFRWGEGGYRESSAAADAPRLLTPPSTLRSLAAGYRPVLHPSVAA